jgi:hypothetical protein
MASRNMAKVKIQLNIDEYCFFNDWLIIEIKRLTIYDDHSLSKIKLVGLVHC